MIEDEEEAPYDEETLVLKAQFQQKLEEKLTELGVCFIPKEEITRYPDILGEGSFGKVFKGKYKERQIAIKRIMLTKDNFEDPEQTASIQDITNEIKSLMIFNDKSIPQFYGLWINEEFFHLVFELVEGKNLKDCYPMLSDKQKLETCLLLTQALQLIHNKHLIHRDIKPANVMVNIDDKNEIHLKLIDFGVSKISNKTLTYTQNQFGTTRYMAPETFDLGKDDLIHVSNKVDIWAMGCLISEIFSNEIPWAEIKNDLVLKKKLMIKTPYKVPASIQNPHILDIINKCVVIDPKERINTPELIVLIKEKISLIE
jgi:serine/threonine protein kinase